MKKLMMILALALVALPMFAATAGAQSLVAHRWACFARNNRGMEFEGTGHERHHAERNALDACYGNGSRHCHIQGCRARW